MLEFNVLDIVHRRRLKTLPKHFAKIKVTASFNNDVEDWIQSKLKGRYWIGNCAAISQEGKLQTAYYAAFEDQKELTYFMLACPFIRRY